MKCEPKRVMAVVQYDGTTFQGFQWQAGQRTVQGVLEDALRKVLGHEVRVKGAGRTDAGAHATGQVVSFVARSRIPVPSIPRALVGLLPPSVLMEEAVEVPMGFDPQREAVSKTYCYRIWRGERPNVLLARFCYRYPMRLDFDVLREEAAAVVGTHDFASFRAMGSSARTTERTVTEAKWVVRDIGWSEGVVWEFWVTADGFLYRMVRLIVGTLLDTARGHLPVGSMAHALSRPGEVKIGRCAPGKGLCLEKVTLDRVRPRS